MTDRSHANALVHCSGWRSAWVALIIWDAARVRSYQRDYGYEGEFPGPTRYHCELRSADAKSTIQCFSGTTDSFLYLMGDPEVQRNAKWRMWENQNCPARLARN